MTRAPQGCPVNTLDLGARSVVRYPDPSRPRECPHPAMRRAHPDGVCLLCDVAEREPIADTPHARATLDPVQRAAIARRASAARMRRSLALFVQRSWHVLDPDTPLEWSWHHDAICDHVQAVLEDWLCKKRDMFGFTQRIRNLVVNLPPGTAKSRIIMVQACAWFWLRCPSWKVLCISSNPEAVNRDAELCRELTGSAWYRTTFDVTWTWREDIDAKKKYRNTAGGERVSRGMAAKFTGVRADAIFLDDPDDAHDVFSDAERRERASKWENSIYNRVNDKRCSVRIGVQQRVHEDDWSAQVLRTGTWTHLDIPMEGDVPACECAACEAARAPTGNGDDVVGTPIGWVDPRRRPGWTGSQILHPARFPVEDLAEERTRLGPYGYECQYNQRPGSLAGGFFARADLRWFTIEGETAGDTPRPDGCNAIPPVVVKRKANGSLDVDWIAVTVDATFGSTSATADNVGLLVGAGKGAHLFVLHDATRKLTFPGTLDAIAEIDPETGAIVGGVLALYPDARTVLVEKAANGAAVVQVLRDAVQGLIEVTPEGGKKSRAAAMMPMIAGGNLHLLDGARWVPEFVDELCRFPNAKHDDRVDALSQMAAHYRTHSAPVARWRRIAQGRRGNAAAPARVAPA